jgi:hypothetical protein
MRPSSHNSSGSEVARQNTFVAKGSLKWNRRYQSSARRRITAVIVSALRITAVSLIDDMRGRISSVEEAPLSAFTAAD